MLNTAINLHNSLMHFYSTVPGTLIRTEKFNSCTQHVDRATNNLFKILIFHIIIAKCINKFMKRNAKADNGVFFYIQYIKRKQKILLLHAWQ